MTRVEFVETVNAFHLPAAYAVFFESDDDAPPKPPYITYTYDPSAGFTADDGIYVRLIPANVNLCQAVPDFEQLNRLVKHLDNAGLVCSVGAPAYDQDQDVWTSTISTTLCED
jgi:hypothetical protein